jgi:hypothetical protein
MKIFCLVFVTFLANQCAQKSAHLRSNQGEQNLVKGKVEAAKYEFNLTDEKRAQIRKDRQIQLSESESSSTVTSSSATVTDAEVANFSDPKKSRKRRKKRKSGTRPSSGDSDLSESGDSNRNSTGFDGSSSGKWVSGNLKFGNFESKPYTKRTPCEMIYIPSMLMMLQLDRIKAGLLRIAKSFVRAEHRNPRKFSRASLGFFSFLTPDYTSTTKEAGYGPAAFLANAGLQLNFTMDTAGEPIFVEKEVRDKFLSLEIMLHHLLIAESLFMTKFKNPPVNFNGFLKTNSSDLSRYVTLLKVGDNSTESIRRHAQFLWKLQVRIQHLFEALTNLLIFSNPTIPHDGKTPKKFVQLHLSMPSAALKASLSKEASMEIFYLPKLVQGNAGAAEFSAMIPNFNPYAFRAKAGVSQASPWSQAIPKELDLLFKDPLPTNFPTHRMLEDPQLTWNPKRKHLRLPNEFYYSGTNLEQRSRSQAISAWVTMHLISLDPSSRVGLKKVKTICSTNYLFPKGNRRYSCRPTGAKNQFGMYAPSAVLLWSLNHLSSHLQRETQFAQRLFSPTEFLYGRAKPIFEPKPGTDKTLNKLIANALLRLRDNIYEFMRAEQLFTLATRNDFQNEKFVMTFRAKADTSTLTNWEETKGRWSLFNAAPALPATLPKTTDEVPLNTYDYRQMQARLFETTQLQNATGHLGVNFDKNYKLEIRLDRIGEYYSPSYTAKVREKQQMQAQLAGLKLLIANRALLQQLALIDNLTKQSKYGSISKHDIAYFLDALLTKAKALHPYKKPWKRSLNPDYSLPAGLFSWLKPLPNKKDFWGGRFWFIYSWQMDESYRDTSQPY